MVYTLAVKDHLFTILLLLEFHIQYPLKLKNPNGKLENEKEIKNENIGDSKIAYCIY